MPEYRAVWVVSVTHQGSMPTTRSGVPCGYTKSTTAESPSPCRHIIGTSGGMILLSFIALCNRVTLAWLVSVTELVRALSGAAYRHTTAATGRPGTGSPG